MRARRPASPSPPRAATCCCADGGQASELALPHASTRRTPTPRPPAHPTRKLEAQARLQAARALLPQCTALWACHMSYTAHNHPPHARRHPGRAAAQHAVRDGWRTRCGRTAAGARAGLVWAGAAGCRGQRLTLHAQVHSRRPCTPRHTQAAHQPTPSKAPPPTCCPCHPLLRPATPAARPLSQAAAQGTGRAAMRTARHPLRPQLMRLQRSGGRRGRHWPAASPPACPDGSRWCWAG